MTNMFAAAKAAAPAKAKAKANDDKPVVEIPGLHEFIEFTALIKNLETIRATLGEEVKEEADAYFKKTGVLHGRKPANISGIEGDSEASITLGKRSTRSPLTPEAVKQLTAAGISTETIVSTTEAYVINPKYSNNSKVLKLVSDAIQGDDNIPSDLIEFQAEVSTVVTTSTTIDEIFATKDTKIIESLLGFVSVIAIKPVVSLMDMGDIILSIRKRFGFK